MQQFSRMSTGTRQLDGVSQLAIMVIHHEWGLEKFKIEVEKKILPMAPDRPRRNGKRADTKHFRDLGGSKSLSLTLPLSYG